MEIFKTKCKYCNIPVLILQLEAHDNSCGKKPINCPVEGCERVFPREYIEKHKETCEFMRIDCIYCKRPFLKKDIQTH